MPSPDKADLVKLFTGVLGFSVESVKLLVVDQDSRSLSDYRAFPANMFPTLAEREGETQDVESQEAPYLL